VRVRLWNEAVEEAAKLGAYHPSKRGHTGLIVGQEVADQGHRLDRRPARRYVRVRIASAGLAMRCESSS
jgi:hypothetical protein